AWADHVLSALRPRAKGLYAGGRFVEVDGVVAFALPSEALQRKAEVMRTEVEAALAAHFGRAVPIRVIVDAPAAAPKEPAVAVDDGAGVDLADLRDAPDAGRTGLDRLTQAFPGAEIVEE
ncbi:MAG: hypothetical protein M3R01_13740, partial [Actinomycetota bacterium]|nr:hypothetical protein [Actinomycetota bacterium]